MREKYPQGNLKLTLADLLAYSLQLSDNNACDILFSRIASPAETDALIRAYGIEDFSISQTEADMHRDLSNCYRNWTSPMALAELIEKAVGGAILNPDSTKTLSSLLIGCKTGADRLPRPLGLGNVLIGHKTGTGDRNSGQAIIGLNDAGFVILPDGKRYVIAVLIKDSPYSYEETEGFISHISGLVYDYLATGVNSWTCHMGQIRLLS